LGIDDLQRNAVGEPLDKVYDDWDGINTVTNLPDEAWHRNVDKIVLAANKQSGGKVHTAIVCPPTIYGPGRGPGNQKSDQVYGMSRAVIKHGRGIVVGKGKNIWTSIHVHDLSDLYLRLTEAAAQGGGKATWDAEGYYFTEVGEFVWGDMARKVAAEAHKQGYIESADVDEKSSEEADSIFTNGSKKWGLNSRCRAIRARKLLGWEPKGESIDSLLPSIVRQEAIDLGVQKTHAEKAAGA
jgi:nucleoside-diphosphate-sugar epimerase